MNDPLDRLWPAIEFCGRMVLLFICFAFLALVFTGHGGDVLDWAIEALRGAVRLIKAAVIAIVTFVVNA